MSDVIMSDFFQAKKIEMREQRRRVFLFHRGAARAAGIFAFHCSAPLDPHFTAASGVGAMPAVFCFHAHGRSLLRQDFLRAIPRDRTICYW